MKSFLKRIRKTNQNDQSGGVKKDQKKDVKDTKSQRHTSLLMDTLSHNKKKVYMLEPPPPVPAFRAAPLRTTKTMPFVYPRSVQNEWRNGTVVAVGKTQNVHSEKSVDLQLQNTENIQTKSTENTQTQNTENAQSEHTQNTYTDPRTRELHHYLRIRQQAASDTFSFVDDNVATLAKRLAGAKEEMEHGDVKKQDNECGNAYENESQKSSEYEYPKPSEYEYPKPSENTHQKSSENEYPKPSEIALDETHIDKQENDRTDYQLLPATRVTITATNPRIRLVRIPKTFI